MNTEPNSKHHPVAWTLAILVAIPVVYLLAIPPALFGYMIASGAPLHSAPPWTRVYLKPYSWFCENSLAKEPCRAYVTWWAKFMGMPHP